MWFFFSVQIPGEKVDFSLSPLFCFFHFFIRQTIQHGECPLFFRFALSCARGASPSLGDAHNPQPPEAPWTFPSPLLQFVPLRFWYNLSMKALSCNSMYIFFALSFQETYSLGAWINLKVTTPDEILIKSLPFHFYHSFGDFCIHTNQVSDFLSCSRCCLFFLVPHVSPLQLWMVAPVILVSVFASASCSPHDAFPETSLWSALVALLIRNNIPHPKIWD